MDMNKLAPGSIPPAQSADRESAAVTTKPGSPIPIFIAGCRYRSIFEAADTGITWTGLYKALKKSRGAPIVVRKQMVVAEFWIHLRIRGDV